MLPELCIVATVCDIETPDGIIPAGSVATILNVYPATDTYMVEFEDFDIPETLATADVVPILDALRLLLAGRAADDDFGEDITHLTPEQMVKKLID